MARRHVIEGPGETGRASVDGPMGQPARPVSGGHDVRGGRLSAGAFVRFTDKEL